MVTEIGWIKATYIHPMGGGGVQMIFPPKLVGFSSLDPGDTVSFECACQRSDRITCGWIVDVCTAVAVFASQMREGCPNLRVSLAGTQSSHCSRAEKAQPLTHPSTRGLERL